MKTKLIALTRHYLGMVDLEDIGLLVCAIAVITGLWWIYPPAALILSGAAGATFIIWGSLKRWVLAQRLARRK